MGKADAGRGPKLIILNEMEEEEIYIEWMNKDEKNYFQKFIPYIIYKWKNFDFYTHTCVFFTTVIL